MEIISNKTVKFKLNLFADFILSKIPPEDCTKIQIIDLGNFWVIKGETSSNEILDIAKIKEEFLISFPSHFEEGFIFQTIDLMKYGVDIEILEKIRIKLFNSDNCSFSEKQIDKFLKNTSVSVFDEEILNESIVESMTSFSTFPHGYSMNQGRNLYYYAKMICYSVSKNYYFDSLIFEIYNSNNQNDFKIMNFSDFSIDQKLTSCVLDSFDFDFVSFNKKMVNYGFFDESINPLYEFDLLKNNQVKLEIF